jgi:hypothetical protein
MFSDFSEERAAPTFRIEVKAWLGKELFLLVSLLLQKEHFEDLTLVDMLRAPIPAGSTPLSVPLSFLLELLFCPERRRQHVPPSGL